MLGHDMQADRPRLNVVTGAFGFSGRYITRRLLARGDRVRTLTNHTDPAAPEFRRIEVAPLDFSDVDQLARHLQGAEVLYNTYWVRFAHGSTNHELAVANTRKLLRAAELAGIRRIVHVSITNPSLDSPLPYFRGKAEVEEAIRASSLSYAILRPAVLFGEEDILINNIAWLLRRSPLFAVPRGECNLQPIFVDDLAALAVDLGGHDAKCTIDAVGPETFAYPDLVRAIASAIGTHAAIIHAPEWMLYATARLVGGVVRDVVLTRDEIRGLMANLLVSHNAPIATTSLSAWLAANADSVGQRYASELARHYDAGATLSRDEGGRHVRREAVAHRHAWW